MRALLPIALVALLAFGAAESTKRPVLPEAGMTRPRLRFGVDSGPHLRQSPSLPAEMPGAISRWTVLQWKKQELLGPDTRRGPVANDADPLLGLPTYVFETESRESRLEIFASPHPPVYELYSRGGAHDADGGTNLFLSARTGRRLSTFDHPITYDVTLRLSHAFVSAPRPRSLKDGSVLAQVFSGFVLAFRQPGAKQATILFLQIRHADSRGRQPDYRSCKLRRDGSAVVIYSGVLPDDGDLPFAPGSVPIRFHYRLNRYLCHALQAPFPCSDDAPNWMPPQAARDLANWRMREMYIGLETQDTSLVARSQDRGGKAGTVEAAVQISGLSVYRDRGRSGSEGDHESRQCR